MSFLHCSKKHTRLFPWQPSYFMTEVNDLLNIANCYKPMDTTGSMFVGPKYYQSMVLAQNTIGPWSWPRILLAHCLGPEYYWSMVLAQNTTGPWFCPRILLAHGFAPEYYWPTVLPQNTTGPRFWPRILLAQS